MELSLNSLGGYEPVIYQWPFNFKDQECEIIEAISFACQEEPPLRKYLDDILSGCVASSYESMKMVCARFNQAVDHLRSLVTSGLYEVERRASVKLLHHVIQTCYNRAVVDPDKLNHYEPFSAEVYGETSFELVHQMIDTIKFSENDQFIDLGSGVGHVVLQVAASTPCKSCFGIEKAHWPALYAKQMSSEFDKWMKFYGKECGSYDLLKGNFLSDDFKDIISNATVIFVNNFAFGPQVDHELKLRFSNLKEGTKIVSSKAFCAMNMQITERNLSDIGAILTVEELSPLRGPVSWTPKRITYYLHTIDRTQLEEYFRMRQKPLKKQKKSLVSNGYRISKTQISNGDIKKNKSTKLWKRNKRPPTISMVSTITAIDCHSVLHCSNVKKALWNDTLNSSSTSPAYIFPSAKIFEETDNNPATGSNGQNVNQVQKNLLDDIHPTFGTSKDSSPLKHCFLQRQTTPKMGFESRTPFSPISSKDMYLGFCMEDNELSDELQLEIENIISLFHSETSKISHQDDYKPSNVYNDLTLLEDYSSQAIKQSEETDLVSICNNKSVVGKSSSPHSKGENDINKVEQAWIQPITPSREMSKFTVSLPRFSPITPDTPNNSYSNNLCTKKCIPFPFLGKANDLFVNISGNVNNPSFSKECNREMVSPVVPATNPPSFATKGANLEKEKFATPFIRPATRILSNQLVGHEIQGDDKGSNILEKSTLADHSLRPHHSPVTGNRPPINWDNSGALTISLPKHILDNSHLSGEDSKNFSYNGIRSDHTKDEHEDEDPPELLFLMNVFRMQYKNIIKSMKHPSFKSKIMREYELQKDYQESLNKQIFKLNSELCELQGKNQILYQQLVRENSRAEFTDHHSRRTREFPSVSSSPGTLDKAICLDSTISRGGSQVYEDHFNPSCDENKQTDDAAIGRRSTSEEIIKIQPPSPEMPLLLPETCSNFIEDEQSNQHSKFTPPPKLTVCISEPKVASFDTPIYCSQSTLCGTESRVNETTRQEICFSPISSCSSESPPQSPNSNNFKCSKRVDSSLKNQLTDNIYYSLLSNSMQNPCLNAEFEGVRAKFPCENTEPLSSFKKRKAPQVMSEYLLRTKRSYVATDPIGQINENTFDSMILRNVLNSKAPSGALCTDSRSDSRDSGFGKDSETDSEASNRSKQNNDPKIFLHAPVQKQHLMPNHCGIGPVDYQSLPDASMIDRITLEGNLKENQVLAHGNMQFRHPITQHQAYQFAQCPTLNQDISCFALNGGQISRPVSSFELSFSSLANYYEKYLSTDDRTFVHDLNLNDNPSSHFNLLRHSYSSAFT